MVLLSLHTVRYVIDLPYWTLAFAQHFPQLQKLKRRGVEEVGGGTQKASGTRCSHKPGRIVKRTSCDEKTELCFDKILRSFTYSSINALARYKVDGRFEESAMHQSGPTLLNILWRTVPPSFLVTRLTLPLFSFLYCLWPIMVSVLQLRISHFKRVTMLKPRSRSAMTSSSPVSIRTTITTKIQIYFRHPRPILPPPCITLAISHTHRLPPPDGIMCLPQETREGDS